MKIKKEMMHYKPQVTAYPIIPQKHCERYTDIGWNNMEDVKDCPGFETFGEDARAALGFTIKVLAERVNIDPRYLLYRAGEAWLTNESVGRNMFL